MVVRIVGSDDRQALLLEDGSRLVVSYAEPCGTAAPDPCIDLTSNGERMMVPMLWEWGDNGLLPDGDVVHQLSATDQGASFTVSFAGDGIRAELDISTVAPDFDDHIATVHTLAADFASRNWVSRHANVAQVRWLEYPDLRAGHLARLVWSIVWDRSTACNVLGELDAGACEVVTVDLYSSSSTPMQRVVWREMVKVPSRSVAEAVEVVSASDACGFELLIVPVEGVDLDYLLLREPWPWDPLG